ncbi:MAG: HNH endonuclease [Fimbriimonadaceae bacterium]|nr:HNH endonuclease [Fimbriimonadaceae bacterium]
MARINGFGLKDYIPSHIRRQVRQRCNFGCVQCGQPFGVDYHHFDPEFKDATKHDPDGITLLCTDHHRQATTGVIGVDTVRDWNANPKARSHGIAGWSPAAVLWPGLTLGSDLYRPNTRYRVEGLEFRVESPERRDGPARVSLRLFDPQAKNRTTLLIVRNEIRIGSSNYDVYFQGSCLYVQERNGAQKLEIDFFSGSLVIRKLKLAGKSGSVSVSKEWTVYRSTPTAIVSVHERRPSIPIEPSQPRHKGPKTLVHFTPEARGGKMIGCDFRGGQTAIHAEAPDLTLEDCSIHDTGTALRVTGGGSVKSRKNKIERAREAVSFEPPE